MMDPPVSAASTSPLRPVTGPPEVYRFRFHGQGGELFVLLLKNVLLTLVTLGIYAAWAKTERRQYTWNRLEVHGQRFLYTGTGKELFIGYLKVVGFYLAFILLAALVGAVAGQGPQAVVQGLLGIAVFVLVPFAIYWSRAYLLSRTQWRGIRFGLVNDVPTFAKTFFLGYLLTLITLGIYGPFWTTELRRIMTNNSRFGSEHFRYDGIGREVFWISVKGLVLSICTLGIIRSGGGPSWALPPCSTPPSAARAGAPRSRAVTCSSCSCSTLWSSP